MIWLARKLIQTIPTFLVVCFFSFLLIRLVPGDPVMLLLGERGANPEAYQELQKNLGLDQSLPKQFLSFMTGLFQLDFGTSIVSKQPVLKEFLDRFPATLELGVMAMIWSTLLGIPLGILAARFRGKIIDFFLMGGSLVGYSMPIFWWGLMAIIVFSVNLGWFPVSGRVYILYDVPTVTGFLLIDAWFSNYSWQAFVSALHHLALPCFVLGTIPLAVIARMTRSSMLEVLGEDYIRTAKSKGVASRDIVYKHALKNALVPIITVAGLLFSSIITGAILTETIFSWPGIGRWLVASVVARDYPVIQGGIVLIAFLIISINILVDLSYFIVNPKMRQQS